MATDIDVLVVGRSVLFKNEQRNVDGDVRRRHLARFQLD